MDGKVKIRMLEDAQGYAKGDELEVGDVRAARWCDRGSIAERVTSERIARPAKAKKASKESTRDEE